MPTDPTPRAREEGDVTLALSVLEKILGGLGYARTARNAEKQDAQYDELARALGVHHERTKIHPFPADIVRALVAALRAAPAEGEDEDAVMRVARNYVGEFRQTPCGDATAILSLADRAALVRAGLALAPTSPRAGAAGEVTVRDLIPETWRVEITNRRDHYSAAVLSMGGTLISIGRAPTPAEALDNALRAARGGGAG